MSVEHRWTRREPGALEEGPGDLRLVITIDGAHDIYRFAHMMLFGQVEFSERARKVIAALKRRMARGQWVYLDRSMGGWQIRREREPKVPVSDDAAPGGAS